MPVKIQDFYEGKLTPTTRRSGNDSVDFTGQDTAFSLWQRQHQIYYKHPCTGLDNPNSVWTAGIRRMYTHMTTYIICVVGWLE